MLSGTLTVTVAGKLLMLMRSAAAWRTRSLESRVANCSATVSVAATVALVALALLRAVREKVTELV